MFPSLLIANRGEIACRIVRTARRLGVETIAVFSEADAHALHVEAADRAVCIGPAPARDSYLNIRNMIAAARHSGARAIHPGYGFLSENPAFAEACLDAGLIWVGPPPDAMRAMGSKAAAKLLMQQAGVPVLPGYNGEEQDAERLGAEARRVNFPVVIKAVAGGGGRGMRVVHRAQDFAAALGECRQEAASAFGDDAVMIERYLERPRHIEVQVFADAQGNAVHLFERDCSAQRRHQKIIEEAPAPGLDSETRAAMGSAAVAAAHAVGYVGAGTVEFVANADGFWFLEMNTRLQVEHPVTEMVTGFDLVEWQLRIADGEPLPASGDAIRIRGHAFEARIYAEDPARDFAPSIGRLNALHLPAQGGGVRVDTGVRQGDSISIHYDPMIAKLICHGDNRAEALGKLRRALAECQAAGVVTNLDLLGRIAAHPGFAEGGIDTGFIARHAETLLRANVTPLAQILALAALGVVCTEANAAAQAAAASADPYSPWYATDGWWLNASVARILDFHIADGHYPVEVRRGATGWRIEAEGEHFDTNATLSQDGLLSGEINNVRVRARFYLLAGNVTMRIDNETWRFVLPDPLAAAEAEAEHGGRLIAPIPGQVTAVHAIPRAKVARGDLLVVMEAMKTVFRLTAAAEGEIAEVACRPGDSVEEGQVLVRFVEAPSPGALGAPTSPAERER
jgi:3-methylcrotonyl-CoA carboxylase alpha subunit